MSPPTAADLDGLGRGTFFFGGGGGGCIEGELRRDWGCDEGNDERPGARGE